MTQARTLSGQPFLQEVLIPTTQKTRFGHEDAAYGSVNDAILTSPWCNPVMMRDRGGGGEMRAKEALTPKIKPN